MRVVLSNAMGGGTDVLDAAQTDVWNRAQNLSLADFQAAWPNIITQYPQFDDADATGTYNMLRSMSRSN